MHNMPHKMQMTSVEEALAVGSSTQAGNPVLLFFFKLKLVIIRELFVCWVAERVPVSIIAQHEQLQMR